MKGGRAGSMATSQCGLPRTKANGRTKISSSKSSLTCTTQSRQSSSLASHDQRADNAGRAVARLGEVVHRFAGTIDPDFPGVGAVEIDLRYVGLL